jgi:hydrogenase-4 component B
MNLSILAFNVFFLLAAAGLLLALTLPERSQRVNLTLTSCLGAIAILLAGGLVLLGQTPFEIILWQLPGLGNLKVSIDALSGLFLSVTGLVMFSASLAASAFLQASPLMRPMRAFSLLYWTLFLSIVLVLCARDITLFFLSWEPMSIACYLLVNWRSSREEKWRSGFVLLAIGEAGTLAALLGFILLGQRASGLDFDRLYGAANFLTEPARWTVFLLTFFGFGVKAGLLPVNFWMPRAYTVAPSAFVPVLAGATLNLGLYGIFRVNGDLAPALMPGAWLVVLVTGAITALVGILYATIENNMKTVLAHSSAENAGIIMTGFGASLAFQSAQLAGPAAIALIASLYHMSNHSLYKTLLFVGTGNVETGARTCDLDRLGGLMRRMPWTGACVLVGCLSIAALPPFNGFVSEWLTLQSLLRSSELSFVSGKVVFALCGALLALASALAITCFVKFFGMAFLGIRRSHRSDHASEPSLLAKAAMLILAVLCALSGILPTYIVPVLDNSFGLNSSGNMGATQALVPPFYAHHSHHGELPAKFVSEFHDIGAQVGQSLFPGRGLVILYRGGTQNPVVFAMSSTYMTLALVTLLLLAFSSVRFLLSPTRKVIVRSCWDGGLRKLLPEMTYTATGFSNPVRVIFEGIFRPVQIEDRRETVAHHFRTAIRREREEIYIVDRLLVRPVTRTAMAISGILREIHHGKLNSYAAYVLGTLLIVLLLGLLLR